MKIEMFTSWQVRCGIADYATELVAGLRALPLTDVDIVPFDREIHPQSDYIRWGYDLNRGDVAHIQHEYSFFGYLTPWSNQFRSLVSRITQPIVITRHVSFDGPLSVPGVGLKHTIRQIKWAMYNRWLGPYARVLNKDTFDIANQIIVLSGRLKDHLTSRGIDAGKIHVIPAGAPVVPPATGGAVIRDRHGWAGKRVIGQFGYIAPAKGHRIMLEALARLPEDYVLLIAGGPRIEAHRTYQNEIEAQISAMGIGNRVRITGFLPTAEVARHIDACDVLVYPYTHADFSYSVATGLAYNHAPVVASDVYVHREIATYCPGLTLFRSGDPAALVTALRQAAMNNQVRNQAFNGMARYIREYTWAAMAEKTRDVYVAATRPSAIMSL